MTCAADTKRFANLQATCAFLHGIALVRTTDDRERPLFVASRAELCKSFSSLGDVEQWLDRVTVKAPELSE